MGPCSGLVVRQGEEGRIFIYTHHTNQEENTGHHGNIWEVVQKRGPFCRPLLLRGPWTPPLTRTSRDMSTLGHIILSTVFSSFSFIFSVFFSSVKSVSGPNASTATLKYGPNILIAHGTTKGGGGRRTP